MKTYHCIPSHDFLGGQLIPRLFYLFFNYRRDMIYRHGHGRYPLVRKREGIVEASIVCISIEIACIIKYQVIQNRKCILPNIYFDKSPPITKDRAIRNQIGSALFLCCFLANGGRFVMRVKISAVDVLCPEIINIPLNPSRAGYIRNIIIYVTRRVYFDWDGESPTHILHHQKCSEGANLYYLEVLLSKRGGAHQENGQKRQGGLYHVASLPSPVRGENR